MPLMRGQFFDERGQLGTQQRLTAGEANLRDAERHGGRHKTHNLLEAQLRAEGRVFGAGLRHAVEATDIAVVGEADAQIRMQRPKVSVSMSPHLRQHALNGNACPLDDIGRKLDAGFERFETVAQFFERIQLHVRALAAIAILVGDEVEAFSGRLSFRASSGRRFRSSR